MNKVEVSTPAIKVAKVKTDIEQHPIYKLTKFYCDACVQAGCIEKDVPKKPCDGFRKIDRIEHKRQKMR